MFHWFVAWLIWLFFVESLIGRFSWLNYRVNSLLVLLRFDVMLNSWYMECSRWGFCAGAFWLRWMEGMKIELVSGQIT